MAMHASLNIKPDAVNQLIREKTPFNCEVRFVGGNAGNLSGHSSKFWRMTWDGKSSEVSINYGRIGTEGLSTPMRKPWMDAVSVLSSKLNKGYKSASGSLSLQEYQAMQSTKVPSGPVPVPAVAPRPAPVVRVSPVPAAVAVTAHTGNTVPSANTGFSEFRATEAELASAEKNDWTKAKLGFPFTEIVELKQLYSNTSQEKTWMCLDSTGVVIMKIPDAEGLKFLRQNPDVRMRV